MSQSGLVTEEQSTESCGNATAAISGGWAASREGQPQPALPQVRCQGTRPPAAIRLVKVLQRCAVTGWEETGQLQALHAQKKKAFPRKLLLPQGNLWTTASHIPPFLPPHTAHAVLPAQRGSAQPSHLSCSTFNGAARQQSVGN